MALVSFTELMGAAEKGGYAVGYFESWDSGSLLAVADAAAEARSPVLLGFSGLYLTHPKRLVQDPLTAYAALGLEVCRQLPVPAALVFNECPDAASVLAAAKMGFGMVMYSDASLERQIQQLRIKEIAEQVHQVGAAVEGELAALPGMVELLTLPVDDAALTDVDEALTFVSETSVDALAVNVGQMHLHGRYSLKLDLGRLRDLRRAVSLPLVLHGASSVQKDDLQQAISLGIRKINVGSLLKQTYFSSLRESCTGTEADYNPYLVVGSGLESDVMTAARLALRDQVVKLMELFGSANKA